MVQCVNGIMEPLPRIDTDAFTAQLEKEWWQGYYGIIDKHALWHERTSFRLWTALLTTLRKSNIELPTRMLKLVRATLKGMRDIMANPKEATQVYVKQVTAHQGKEASILRTFEFYNQYVYAKQKVLGVMDEQRLADLQKFYVSNGVVPKEVPVKELYTNQFVTAK